MVMTRLNGINLEVPHSKDTYGNAAGNPSGPADCKHSLSFH
jgi:hypothetical protein